VFHLQVRLGGADRGGPWAQRSLRGHENRSGCDSGRGAQSYIHGCGSKRGAPSCIHARLLSLSPYSRLIRLVSTPSRASSSMWAAGVHGQAWLVAAAPDGSRRDNFPPQACTIKSDPVAEAQGRSNCERINLANYNSGLDQSVPKGGLSASKLDQSVPRA
jgi:hypothetical protein